MFNHKSAWVFILINLFLFFFFFGLWHQRKQADFVQDKRIAKALLLTDLCLTTESRHTRHLSTAELMAPFQDFPGGPDHFPSSMFLQHPASYFYTSSPEKVK